MSRYVMSDIHGCYTQFMMVLERMSFDHEKDHLYILGDVMDKGQEPLKIIDYIVDHKDSVTLLKGNHEAFFQDYIENGHPGLWYPNGGEITHVRITERGEDYQKALYDYIVGLPFVKVVDKFILVHAGLKFPKGYEDMSIKEFMDWQDEDTCLWDRSNLGQEKQFKDYTVVCGHTPVQVIAEQKEVSIIKRKGTIYMDCGCVFKQAMGRLACLRLDDMEVFYDMEREGAI